MSLKSSISPHYGKKGVIDSFLQAHKRDLLKGFFSTLYQNCIVMLHFTVQFFPNTEVRQGNVMLNLHCIVFSGIGSDHIWYM